MPNVEIIDTLYENMCEHIEVLKKKYPYKSHTIKDFVNISNIVNNTKPTHIDIISDEDFHKDLKKRLTKVKKWKRTHGK